MLRRAPLVAARARQALLEDLPPLTNAIGTPDPN